MVNLIPMAGEGTRYAREGYLLPKCLVPVSGVPMVVKAIRGMPRADAWVFVVRRDHVAHFGVDRVIRCEVPEAVIVEVEGVTAGQACTCLLGMPHLDREDSLFIGSCDCTCLYSQEKYAELVACPDVDAVVWTFTRHEALRVQPRSFGWVLPGDDGRGVKDVSVKTPVSANPYEDHAIVSWFHFRKAGEFQDAVALMMADGLRTNNEYYVDVIPRCFGKMGKRTVFFDIDRLLGWGTPAELYRYQRLEALLRGGLPGELTNEELRLLPLLNDYFLGRSSREGTRCSLGDKQS